MQRVNELYGQLEQCTDDNKRVVLLFDLSTSLLNFDERKNQEVTEELGALAERLDSNIARSYYHSAKARLLFRKSMFKEATSEFELASERAMLTDDVLVQASNLDSLGIAYRIQGKFKESLEATTRALEIFKSVPDTHRYQSVCYNNLGSLYKDQKEFAKAKQVFEQGLEIGKLAGDERMVSNLYNNLAGVSIMTGKYGQGEGYAKKALTGFRKLKHKHGEVHALVFLGHCILGLGNDAEALQHYVACIKLLKNVDHKLVEVQAYKGIGNVYAKMQACNEALKNYNKAYKLSIEVEDYEEACEVYLAVANMYQIAQELPQAKLYLQKAHALSKEYNFQELTDKIVDAQKTLGDTLVAD